MDDLIFSEGGPHGVRRTGPDEYEMRLSIPTDSHGMMGRECPDPNCVPGFFKVKPGTGITENQAMAFCPYCRRSAEPGDFLTKAQHQYALDVVKSEVSQGIDRMFRRALGVGPSGKKTFGGGLLSVELSYKSGGQSFVPRPVEEELRRDIRCPNCTLDHAVFGLATWCPDCGADVFESHIDEEFTVIRKMLAAVDQRRATLGPRVAARDIENALEDTVSTFEAVLKSLTRRHLRQAGKAAEDIDQTLERAIRNQYQNPTAAADVFRSQVGVELFADISDTDRDTLHQAFEKRHPITHNLGIVDRKYLQRVQAYDLHGRDVRIGVAEVEHAINIASRVLKGVYGRIFGPRSDAG